MNFKSIFKHIYLVTVTFIYMVAVALVLVGILVFAIVNEILKQVKFILQAKSKKIVYRTFTPLKQQPISSKQEQLWNRF